MTPLQWARHLHDQAVRNLRRLDAEARRQRSATLDNTRAYCRERVARTLADLRAIEATQPDGAGIHQLTQSTPDASNQGFNP